MNKRHILVGLMVVIMTGTISVSAQTFTKTKPKVGLSAECFGLGIDNFGILNDQGKEVLDFKELKRGDQVKMAFYNLTGFEVKSGLAHLRMNITIVDQTDNTILVASQSLLDEKLDPAKLKEDYIYGIMSMSNDFIKGKSYLIRLHLWDVNNGSSIDLIWKFKVNFK